MPPANCHFLGLPCAFVLLGLWNGALPGLSKKTMCSGLFLVSLFYIHLCHVSALDSVHFCFRLGLCHQRPTAYFGREGVMFIQARPSGGHSGPSPKAFSSCGPRCRTLWSFQWKNNSSPLLEQVLRMLLKL